MRSRLFVLTGMLILLGTICVGCANGDGSGGGLGGLLGRKADGSGDRYSILLMRVKGPKHIADARHYEEQTKKQARWEDVYVVHKDKHSLLFRGNYTSVKQAEKYLRQAKDFVSKVNMKPFGQAMTVPLPGKPLGPPEWNIENVKCDCTVLIATFHNTDRIFERKKAAVETCRWLRERGWDAYYHHDLTDSGVMIGRFDRSVAKMITKPGHPPELMVISPKVKAIQKEFPQLVVNGAQELIPFKDSKTGRVHKVPVRTKLIHHPSRKVAPQTVKAPKDQPPRGTEGGVIRPGNILP